MGTPVIFNHGDDCFLASGEEARFIARVGNQTIVQVYATAVDEYGEEMVIEGELRTVTAVFKQCPKPLMGDAVQKLREEEAALRTSISELRIELGDAERDNKERLKKLQRHQALVRIEEFLEGKITHYVERSYGRIKVIEKMKAGCSYETDNGRKDARSETDLKLLTLFGKSNGDLQWMLNHYRDGSGSSWTEVVPCTSLEEAREVAAKLFEQEWDMALKEGKGGTWTGETIKSAQAQNFPVPAAVQEMYDKATEAQVRAQLGQLDKQREELAKKLPVVA